MRNSLTLIFTIVLLTISISAQGTATNGSSATAGNERKEAFRPTKAQITAAQEKLKSSGSYSGAADGRYNDEFRTSLKVFQGQNGLEKTGRVDEATLNRMGIALSDRQRGIETASDKPKRVVFRPTKEQITSVQQKLAQSGAYSGGETGKYTPELRSAIREYQTANGLKRTGSLNRATLEKFGIALTDEQSAIPVNPEDFASGDTAPAKRGPVFRATKEQITDVQTKLKAAGLYNGEADGKFNDDFRAAIKSWQEANGVKQTGTLNKATLEAMKIELTAQQKEM